MANSEGWARPRVRGLPLPRLLVRLLDDDQWRHPGEDVLKAVIPWFDAPLDFLRTPGEMGRESQFLYEDGSADDRRESAFFHVVRGGVTGRADLPWLDVGQALTSR